MAFSCPQCHSETWGIECQIRQPDFYDDYTAEIEAAVDRMQKVLDDMGFDGQSRPVARRMLWALYSQPCKK